MKTDAKRISSDNITTYRVIAMTMVVLYHCTCYYAHPTWPFGEGPYSPILKALTTLMGGIHMPVFVFISGYLFWMFKFQGKYTDVINFYKGKVLRIIVPYICIGGGILLIFNEIYTPMDLLYGICHLWFLLMLFGVFVLAPILWKIFENVKEDRLVTILVLSSFLIFPIFHSVNLLQVTKVFYFLPYFSFGYLLLRRGTKALYTDWLFWTFLIVSMMGLYLICPRSLFIDKVIRQYASMVVILALALVPNFSIPEKVTGIINNISTNSMGIYLFHQVIVAQLMMTSYIKLWLDTTNCYIGVIFLFMTTFCSSWIFSFACNRIRLTRLIIGSKIR